VAVILGPLLFNRPLMKQIPLYWLYFYEDAALFPGLAEKEEAPVFGFFSRK
jgi:hypothetical protein